MDNRRNEKKAIKKGNLAAAIPALVFCALLAAFSLLNLALPKREFSEKENRPLAPFPAPSRERILSGSWMTDFETYTVDQLMFRDGFMSVKTAADRLILRKDNGNVYFGRDGYLFSMDNLNEKQEEKNLAVLTRFLEQTRQAERTQAEQTQAQSAQTEHSHSEPPLRISVLLAPTAKSILPELLPDYAPVSDEPAAVERARAALLAADPALCFTDPSKDLDQTAHENGTAIYYRTDHHWTTDGAYTAYRRWAQDNGFTPVAADAFIRTAISDSFLGTNDSKAPGAADKTDSIVRYTLKDSSTAAEPAKTPEMIIWKDITKPAQTEIREGLYDETALEKKDQYTYFLGGNDPQILIRTGANTGRSLLLIKDSYANCMIPFLALHYDEITVTDLRYSHGKILPAPPAGTTAASATDILFLYNIESFCNDRNFAYLTQLKLMGN